MADPDLAGSLPVGDMILRDYQQAAHDAVLSAWGEKPWWTGGETYRSLIANLPTSAGKTVLSGALIDTVRKWGRCLFLADTDELCQQPVDKFSRLFNIHAGIEKAGKRASQLDTVVVGSAQTLCRQDRLERFSPNHFSYIFVDEAHRGSDRNKRITDYFGPAKVMGITATPFRAKLADLSDYYDHVAFELGLFDLIDEGYIPPLKVLMLPVNVDLNDVHQTMTVDGMDFDKDEVDEKITPYFEEICRMVLEHAKDRTIIAYHVLIKTSQKFVEIARQFGIDARHVDGKSPDREELIRGFERGNFQLLSNSSLLTTGWDCPRCDCLLNLAPTRSAVLFRQKVGRIGRALPGVVDGLTNPAERKAAIAGSAKPNSLILDLLWQTDKFNLQGPADLIATDQAERDEINRRLRIDGGDLQEVSAKVQKEREDALKQALIDAAARRTSGFNDAINLVAAMLHGRAVTKYQPVMKWHSEPVSDKQKAWLDKQGFDPASATDKGHVSAFMNLILGRKRAGLCSYKAVDLLEKMEVKSAISYTEEQAFEVLQGNYPVGFSKRYKGVGLRHVPFSFWDWTIDASDDAEGDRRGWLDRDYPVEARWAREKLRRPKLVEVEEEEELPGILRL